MVNSRPVQPADPSQRRLIERVVAGNASAWREFTEGYSRLLFSLLWRYADKDQDQCADLYLYVIEGLHATNEAGETFYRFRRYLTSLQAMNGKGRLTTWLGRVTQNLVSDHFREREGRRTLPRAIGRMDATHQRIFKLLYWKRLTEREAHATLDSQLGGLSRAVFDDAVETINLTLKTCNRWTIYSEIMRRTPALPISAQGQDPEEGTPSVQIADSHPGVNPDGATEQKTSAQRALELGEVLTQALQELNDEQRLMLTSRWLHNLTARQIAKLLDRSDSKKIYSEIDGLKKQLRGQLEKAGFHFAEVASGLGVIEGLLAKASA